MRSWSFIDTVFTGIPAFGWIVVVITKTTSTCKLVYLISKLIQNYWRFDCARNSLDWRVIAIFKLYRFIYENAYILLCVFIYSSIPCIYLASCVHIQLHNDHEKQQWRIIIHKNQFYMMPILRSISLISELWQKDPSEVTRHCEHNYDSKD